MPSTIRQLRVFLCHASQDKSIVRELQQRLADEGWIDPWLDEKKLHPGEDWRVLIEEAVESSDSVVICLSNNSVDKEGFVQKELRYAREIALEKTEGTIFLIPLRLEDCDVPRGLRFFQWADYFGAKKEQSYTELLDSFSIRRQQVVRREQERALREAEEKERQEREEKARKEAEEKERKEKEEKARKEAEELAKREAEELARQKALEISIKEEERIHLLALEKVKKETFEKTLEDAREKARLEAEVYAQKEIKEKKHKGNWTNLFPTSFITIISLLLVGLVFGIGLVGLGQMGMGPFAKELTPTSLTATPFLIPATENTATTPSSVTSVPPPSAGNLLFSEDFDDGFADGFTFQSGNWQVVDDATGNKVLEMTSTTCCANGLFGPSIISDGIVEFRYKLISANYQAQHHVATFGFRLKISAGNFTSYSLIYEPAGSNLSLIYQENGGAWQPVERSSGGGSIQPQSDGWIKLRVEFQGENIKVFINDNSFTAAQDSRDKEGSLILGANGAVTVQFDDIKVWEISK